MSQTKPYKYQIQDARALHRMDGRCLLANEMGLGKSLISLMYAERHPEARPIIIVCPAGLKFNWEREVSKHFNWYADILEGMKASKVGFRRPQSITIVNYDILGPWTEYLRSLEPKLIILDEAHFLQNPSTKRTKAVRLLCQGVPHVIALTGTPLVNRPIEMWPTLNILYPKKFPSYYQFGMVFCGARRNPFSGGWDFRGASHLDQLNSLLKGVMIRRTKQEVLRDLPAKQRFVVPLEISDRDQYEHAHENFLDWLVHHKPEKMTSAMKAEGLVKLGYLKRLAATLKLPFVFEWIDSFLRESNGKLIVFGLHRNILQQLEQRYRKLCVVVHGSIKGKDRQAAVDQFQHHQPTRLFIGQMRAAGVGLNLTKAADVAFAELEWVPGVHTQCEDRCYGRLSDLHGANSWWLTGKATIEDYVAQVLQEKQQTVSAVLDGNGKVNQLAIFDQLIKAMRNGT